MMEPQPTFPVNVKLWLHSDMYLWVPFYGFGGPQDFKSGGRLELQQLLSDYGAQMARF